MTPERCEVCNSPMRMKAFLGGTPYEDDPAHLVCSATPLDHWRLGYVRLKAENASLPESLREAEKEIADREREGIAAEQRNTELEGALRALVRLKDGPRDDWYRGAKEKAWADARAALHDEGRPKDYDPITAPIPDGDMNGPHGPLPALHDEGRSAPPPAQGEEK